MNMAPGYFQRKIKETIEPKEIPSSLIPHLLVVFTLQLELLVTTLNKGTCDKDITNDFAILYVRDPIL